MSSMVNKLVVHESAGEAKQMPGRLVTWVHKPEITGGKHCSVCVVVYEPGARAKPAHSHPHGEETVYVISGSGKVKIGESVFDIEPGSVLFFPQEVPHMVWNSGSEPLKLSCFYAPDGKAIEYKWFEDYDFDEFKS